jgi:hypothetical protein
MSHNKFGIETNLLNQAFEGSWAGDAPRVPAINQTGTVLRALFQIVHRQHRFPQGGRALPASYTNRGFPISSARGP